MAEPDWRTFLDAAVPTPEPSPTAMSRLESLVRAARRRRRWAAAGSPVAVVALVTGVVMVTGASASHRHETVAAPTVTGTAAITAAPSPTTTTVTTSPAPASAATPSTVPTATSASPTPAGAVASPCSAHEPAEYGPKTAALTTAFTPVAGYLCVPDLKRYPGSGTWNVIVGKRLEGDLGPLFTALREPDLSPLNSSAPAPGASAPVLACTDNLVVVWPILLVDADGRQLWVRVPRDTCNKPSAQVRELLSTTSTSTVQVVKVAHQLTEAESKYHAAAGAAGCQPQWKDELLIGMASNHEAQGPLALSGKITACLFRDDAKDPTVGDYVGHLSAGNPQVAALVASSGGPRIAVSCSTKHHEFIVLSDNHGRYDWVETGGCSRVLRDDGVTSGVGSVDARLVQDLLSTFKP